MWDPVAAQIRIQMALILNLTLTVLGFSFCVRFRVPTPILKHLYVKIVQKEWKSRQDAEKFYRLYRPTLIFVYSTR